MTDLPRPTADSAGCLSLPVVGEIDLHTVPDLERDATSALAGPDVNTLALVLRGVTFIDSTGIGTLIRLRQAADEAGKNFVLRQPSESVRRVLRLTALVDDFTIEPDDAAS
jgi:anti-anti-sigma factor